MIRLLQLVTVLVLAVLLGALIANGDQEKLESLTNRHKGAKMLRHRPWYSGKRDVVSSHNEVGKQFKNST